MLPAPPALRIHVRDLRLWAHVGVLEQERQLGQWFTVSFSLLLESCAATSSDALEDTLDYSRAIAALQEQARGIRCRTIEHYASRMADRLEALYGAVPLRLELGKCRAPVPGFTGSVAVELRRRWPGGSGDPA
ncbi:MAG: dihydroneopterin aldolase [Prochlorococcaceae cyanobacterium]|jgi:dihydroneopterin aldolase